MGIGNLLTKVGSSLGQKIGSSYAEQGKSWGEVSNMPSRGNNMFGKAISGGVKTGYDNYMAGYGLGNQMQTSSLQDSFSQPRNERAGQMIGIMGTDMTRAKQTQSQDTGSAPNMLQSPGIVDGGLAGSNVSATGSFDGGLVGKVSNSIRDRFKRVQPLDTGTALNMKQSLGFIDDGLAASNVSIGSQSDGPSWLGGFGNSMSQSMPNSLASSSINDRDRFGGIKRTIQEPGQYDVIDGAQLI